MIIKIFFQVFRSTLFPEGLQIIHYATSKKEVIEFFNKKLKKWGVDYVLESTEQDSLIKMCEKICVGVKTKDFGFGGGAYVDLSEITTEELCLSMITDLTQVKHNAELLAPIASQMEIVLKQALKR